MSTERTYQHGRIKTTVYQGDEVRGVVIEQRSIISPWNVQMAFTAEEWEQIIADFTPPKPPTASDHQIEAIAKVLDRNRFRLANMLVGPALPVDDVVRWEEGIQAMFHNVARDVAAKLNEDAEAVRGYLQWREGHTVTYGRVQQLIDELASIPEERRRMSVYTVDHVIDLLRGLSE